MKAVIFAAISVVLLPVSGFADESEASYAKWNELRGELFSSGETSETLEGVTIPHLVSAKLEKAWGKPEMWVLEDGSYGIRYRNPDPASPFEVVTILGFAKPTPALASAPDQSFDEIVDGELSSVERPQDWQAVKLTIAGDTEGKRELRYFREYAGGGADGPRDSTNTFTVTANGKTGYYVVIVDTITDATKKRLKTLAVE